MLFIFVLLAMKFPQKFVFLAIFGLFLTCSVILMLDVYPVYMFLDFNKVEKEVPYPSATQSEGRKTAKAMYEAITTKSQTELRYDPTLSVTSTHEPTPPVTSVTSRYDPTPPVTSVTSRYDPTPPVTSVTSRYDSPSSVTAKISVGRPDTMSSLAPKNERRYDNELIKKNRGFKHVDEVRIITYQELDFKPKKDVHCINKLSRELYGKVDMTIRIPNDQVLATMDNEELKCLYYRYATTRQTFCTRAPQLGNSDLHSNGWHICLDEQYKPHYNSCNVYTVNDSRETEFRRHVSLQLGCRMRRFMLGPMKSISDSKRSNITDELSSVDLRQLEEYMRGSKDIIDVMAMRMDIEDLEAFVSSPQIRRVRQLAVELRAPVKATDTKKLVKFLRFLRTLWKRGFRVYHFERKIEDECLIGTGPKTTISNCYVLYLVNRKLKRTSSLSNKTSVQESAVFPTEEEIMSASPDKLEDIYHSFIQSVQYPCREIIRVGKLRDGGWEICHDKNTRPKYPCLVYSFGINNDFSFDDDISQTYGCETHSFDPSMNKKDHRRSDRVWFHSVGLSGNNTDQGGKWGTWPLRTLKHLTHHLNHTNKRMDILKMDIEKSEWSALPDMMATRVLDNVGQLLIEFHGKGNTPDIVLTLKRLHDYGFMTFWTNGNQICQYKTVTGSRSICNEVYFVNTKLV